MPLDSFQENIEGVRQLIESDDNKIRHGDAMQEEGVSGQYEDILELPMPDEELLELRDEWENSSARYLPKIKSRQDRNKVYYQGKQHSSSGQDDKVVASNLIFEAEETFIPQALSKNPEPVVWSDNTDIGKEASNQIKTMLQYHADVLCLRKKLGVMVRHWSIYFLGVVKHGWDDKVNDIKTEIRKPQNFILDPDGYVDEYGNFVGDFLGERITCTAKRLIELYPKHKDYILLKVNGKLGTSVTYTEWWTDEYCFSTYMDVVLDKHKNEYFNYERTEKGTDQYGLPTQTVTPAINHFAVPKMPYTFLSVFSLQERPHDITNLIEQNIANQDRINRRDEQIDKNLASANNAVVLSGQGFTVENAAQVVEAFFDEGFILNPSGLPDAVKRIPASPLPNGIMQSQAEDKVTLRSIFGTQGLTAQPNTEETTARGMILNQSHDSSRIGGGVGDALEQVADNIFNWWLQLYCVFYDEPHYAAIMGNGRAVEYVQVVNSDLTRKFVVSVAPNSMQPKDEITEQNLAIDLANKGWLDPINLYKKLNYPDPMETAKMVAMWKVSPQMYMQMFFPEAAPQPVMGPQGANPPDLGAQGGSPPETLAAPPASSALSQVPLSTEALPQ